MTTNESRYPSNLEDHVEVLFAHTNSSAAVPVDMNGTPLLGLLRHYIVQNYASASGADRQTILRAAVASHALSLGRPDTVPFCDVYPAHIQAPDVSGISFVPQTGNIPKRSDLRRETALTGHASVKEALLFILQQQQKLAQSVVEKGQTYTPMFLNRHDPHSQLDRRDALATQLTKMAHLASDIERQDDADLSSRVKAGIIVNPITRFHAIPSAIPAMQKGDFDSGHCDQLALSAGSAGEPVYILLESGDWRLVATQHRHGWVAASHVADIAPAQPDATHIPLPEYLYYTGSAPQFGTDAEALPYVLLPGTPLVVSSEGTLSRLKRTRDGHLRTVPVTIPDPNLVQGAPHTPQQMMNRIYSGGPYMHAIHDCSSHITRVFEQNGWLFPRYSGDMTTVLEHAGIPLTVIQQPDELDELDHGIYLTELVGPTGKSTHVSMLTITDTRWESASCAFALPDEHGTIHYPVGFDVSSCDAVRHQIAKRTLRCFLLAKLDK